MFGLRAPLTVGLTIGPRAGVLWLLRGEVVARPLGWHEVPEGLPRVRGAWLAVGYVFGVRVPEGLGRVVTRVLGRGE